MDGKDNVGVDLSVHRSSKSRDPVFPAIFAACSPVCRRSSPRKVSVGTFTHSLVVIDLYSLGGTRGLTPVTYLHAFNACLSVIVW